MKPLITRITTGPTRVFLLLAWAAVLAFCVCEHGCTTIIVQSSPGCAVETPKTIDPATDANVSLIPK